MDRLLKQISQAYYYIYTATILTTVIGYVLTMNDFNPIPINSPKGIVLKSIVITYMMISIPLGLSIFFRQTKKCLDIKDEEIKFQKYKKAAILRLILIGTSLIGSILVFFLIRTDVSLIYCAGISAIILLFFCKPTESKITSDLKLDETEEDDK